MTRGAILIAHGRLVGAGENFIQQSLLIGVLIFLIRMESHMCSVALRLPRSSVALHYKAVQGHTK